MNETSFHMNLPFYENNGDGSQCATIGMKIAIEHFTSKKVDLEQLDKLVGRTKGKWTWDQQVTYGLYKSGLNVHFYSNEELEPFLEGVPFMKKRFGKSADKLIEHLDLDAVLESTKKCLELNIFEKKKLNTNDLEDHLVRGHVVLTPVDWNIIKGKDDIYHGHILILTGFDKENFYAHNSGPINPEKNMKIKKSLLEKAWKCNELKNTTVVIFGKRN